MPNKPAPLPVISSPCIDVCELDEHGYCLGCRRTGDEIARWRDMSEGERQYVMQAVLPLRKVSW